MNIAVLQAVHKQLLPSLKTLRDGIDAQAQRYANLVKTGRTVFLFHWGNHQQLKYES